MIDYICKCLGLYWIAHIAL